MSAEFTPATLSSLPLQVFEQGLSISSILATDLYPATVVEATRPLSIGDVRDACALKDGLGHRDQPGVYRDEDRHELKRGQRGG